MNTFSVPRYVLYLILAASIAVLSAAIFSYFTTSTFVVFCNVGQGDATYMRINNRVDVLVDAGPDDAILECLGKYMPFYDKAIELAFITHPHVDHYGGFSSLLGKYSINMMFASETEYDSSRYDGLIRKYRENGTHVQTFYSGQILHISDAHFRSFWPSKSYLEASTRISDLNSLSHVMLFTQRNVSIMFTGDVTPEIQKRLIQQPVPKVTILKIPHHGSTEGLIEDFLILADPTYSVISVGKANRYGHPHRQTLEMLRNHGYKYKRTDEDNDVIFRF